MNAAANPNILALRPDFRAIARWVEPNSTVLDLGCGDGSLLRVLQDELSVQAYGVEIRDEGVLSCAQKGVHVIQQGGGRAQAVRGQELRHGDPVADPADHPQHRAGAARHAARGTRVHRVLPQLRLLAAPAVGVPRQHAGVGVAALPVVRHPNVRVLTIKDFEALAPKVGLRVLDRVVMHEGVTVNWAANWRGSLAVYRVCSA